VCTLAWAGMGEGGEGVRQGLQNIGSTPAGICGKIDGAWVSMGAGKGSGRHGLRRELGNRKWRSRFYSGKAMEFREGDPRRARACPETL
jgi:hypothetical protein